jgi:hypothetical protein
VEDESMRAPTSLEELVTWYRTGLITGSEFFPLLLFLISEDSVAEVMRDVPAELVDRVLARASALCEARASGESTVDFNFGGPVADDAAEAALCRWLGSRGHGGD